MTNESNAFLRNMSTMEFVVTLYLLIGQFTTGLSFVRPLNSPYDKVFTS